MRKRFVIAAQLTSEKESKLIAFFKEQRAGWWHRVPNFWLVTTKNEALTSQIIRDKVKEMGTLAPTTVVMEIDEDKMWHGTHPIGEIDTFDWLKASWAEKEV